MPVLRATRSGVKAAGKVAKVTDDYVSPVAGLQGVSLPGYVKPLALVSQKQYGAAAANLAGGSAAEAAARVAGRGLKTALRAGRGAKRAGLLRSKRVKKQAIAAVRGATTGAIKNRRLIADAATGGALSVGSVANAAVKKTIGNTRVGRALTADIGKPLYNALQLRRRLRTATGGVFSRGGQTLKFIHQH